MAKNSSIGSSLYFEYFSGMACSDQSAPKPTDSLCFRYVCLPRKAVCGQGLGHRKRNHCLG